MCYFSSSMLNNLSLVDQGGMGTDHSGARSGFGSQRAISLLIVGTVNLGDLGTVGLAVLVVGMLLAGRTPQTFIHLVLIIWRVAAAPRRVLVMSADASWPRTPVSRDNVTAVELSHNLSGLHHGECCWRKRRVETSFLLQRHKEQTRSATASSSAKYAEVNRLREMHSTIWWNQATACPEIHAHYLTKDIVLFLTYVSTLSRFSSSLSRGLSLPLRVLLCRTGLPK